MSPAQLKYSAVNEIIAQVTQRQAQTPESLAAAAVASFNGSPARRARMVVPSITELGTGIAFDSGLEIPSIGHGRRVGRVSQRWVVHASRMSRRMMMTALARAMNASMTWTRFSAQMASLRKPRLCQEFVLSTTHRAPACSGNPFRQSSRTASFLVCPGLPVISRQPDRHMGL